MGFCRAVERKIDVNIKYVQFPVYVIGQWDAAKL